MQAYEPKISPGNLMVRPATGYAGDISPQLACQWWLAGDGVLIDVRTDAEREWVGFVPGAAPAAWKLWPGMALNPAFDSALMAAMQAAMQAASQTELLATRPAGKKALMLCRSGIRSIAAAKRATELGFEAYNILEGFEGDPDANGHRGLTGGWRHLGLPWRQG
jgi:sulfur dioxygenase